MNRIFILLVGTREPKFNFKKLNNIWAYFENQHEFDKKVSYFGLFTNFTSKLQM